MNKIKPVWFYSLYRNNFFWVKQWSLTCAGYTLLFSELHDVKTERSMSCKEQCPLLQYREKWNHIIFIFIKTE